MKYNVDNVEDYIAALPEERRLVIEKLRGIILANLPEGFVEVFSYGMIGYVLPLSTYKKGYHVNKEEPLPFLSLASQKNYIALYHMGIYGNKELEKWFVDEYGKRVSSKLDMGKSCIRFKKLDAIPYDLIGQLCGKITVDEYIDFYEGAMKSSKKL